uniref:Uncharacterized protein n=1 Tax=Cacopsylla melanoneura TaxID=428564 RepID=A0A8D8X5H6_9HEMI
MSGQVSHFDECPVFSTDTVGLFRWQPCSVAPQDNFAFLLFLQKLAKVYRKYFTVQTNGGPWSNIAGIPTCGRCGTQRFNYTSFFKEEKCTSIDLSYFHCFMWDVCRYLKQMKLSNFYPKFSHENKNI